MATDRTGEGGISIPARPVSFTATATTEIDTIDWRPKFTVRIQLNSPDTSALVIRAANEKHPEARSHGVKILSTGASHANPGFVSAALMALEDGRPQPYMINNQVTFDSSDSSGAVRGAFELVASRYAEDGQMIHKIVWRHLNGAFAATHNPVPELPPKMTAQLQERILRRALDGYIITWSGAINGDGDASSTQSPALAREFLSSRWDAAMTIDSLSTSPQHTYVRLRGRYVPIVCSLSDEHDDIRCERRPKGTQ